MAAASGAGFTGRRVRIRGDRVLVPGAGLVRPEAASEQQLSSSFDAAGAPEFVPGGAFGSGLLGAPQKPGQPQGSGLLWDR